MLIYDLIRSIRNTWRHKKILIAAEDFVFWIAISIFLFTRVYIWNNGILRWYFFAGLLLGMLLYAAVISFRVVKFVSFFLKRLKMFFSWGNIILNRIFSVIIRFLGIKNGEDVKKKEKKDSCECSEQEE